jgi:membrane-associated phospholipid phosphatase
MMGRAQGRVLSLSPEWSLSALAIATLAAIAALLGGRLVVPADTIVPYGIASALIFSALAILDLPLLVGSKTGCRRAFLGRQRRALRVWLPFIILYVCYRALRGTLLALVDHGGVQDSLKRADEILLGVSPAWWMESFASPWLTELMAYAYSTMFLPPLVVMLWLYGRKQDDALREVGLALLTAFYLGFFLFLLVPAKSPDVVYHFGTELSGYGFYEWSTQAWRQLQQVTFDAFPSMHTCISTIALVHTYRYGKLFSRRYPRLLFALALPLAIALQLATLYLRQHYFVDLLAGWGLAALSLFIARNWRGG